MALPFAIHIATGCGVVAVETQEDNRLVESVAALKYNVKNEYTGVMESRSYTVLVWTPASGGRLKMAALDDGDEVVLSHLGDMPYKAAFAEAVKKERTILVMFGFQMGHAKTPTGVFDVKEAQPELRRVRSTLVLVAPSWSLVPEIEKDFEVVRLPLATEEELGNALDVVAESIKSPVPEELRLPLLRAAHGLTLQQAEDGFARMVKETGGKYVPKIISKITLETIKAEGLIEPEEPEPIDNVDGLEELQKWIRERVVPSYGTPLGIRRMLLVGPPGTGKSSVAKIMASHLQVKLVSISLSNMESKWVGDSQANLRKVLATIDAIGHAVVWIDEAGDQFKGADSNSDSGSPLTKMVGELSKWMEEKQGRGIIMIFTANERNAFPKKILGRMNAKWFLDLPNSKERFPIAKCIMRRYAVPAEYIDAAAAKLAELSDGWSGREMRECIEEACAVTNSKVTPDAIKVAASSIKPLSQTEAEYITAIREDGLANMLVANTMDKTLAGGFTVKRAIEVDG